MRSYTEAMLCEVLRAVVGSVDCHHVHSKMIAELKLLVTVLNRFQSPERFALEHSVHGVNAHSDVCFVISKCAPNVRPELNAGCEQSSGLYMYQTRPCHSRASNAPTQ